MSLTKEEYFNLEQIEKYKRKQWLIDVKVMKAGESFGELALKNDAPRAATI
jgi:CRP-like cAMP-binding protein